MIILEDRVDNRHVVAIDNSYSFADAITIEKDENGEYKFDRVMYMIDDVRTWGNEAIIDATEEELEAYRRKFRHFKPGDKVKIVEGRKMKGEVKEIKSFFKFVVPNTYGKVYTNYVVFTDDTKVNSAYIEFAED